VSTGWLGARRGSTLNGADIGVGGEVLPPDPLCDRSAPNVFWTTTNIVEGFPGVVTPLTWTLWGPRMDVGSRRAYAKLGILTRAEAAPDVPLEQRFSGIFFGRAALNVDVIRTVADRAPGTSGAAAEEQLLGNVRPEVVSRSSRRRLPAIAVRLPFMFLTEPRRVERFLVEQRAWWRAETSGSAPARPAATRMAEAGQRLEDALARHSICSMIAVALLDQTATLSEQAGQPHLQTLLNTGHGNVEEAALVVDLWELSRGRRTLNEVLADHGYHGSGELSLPSYRVAPEQLEAIAARYRSRPESEAPQRLAARQRGARLAAERQVLAALPRRKRAGAKLLFRLAGRGIPLREASKACFVMALDVARVVAADRYKELAAQGYLTEPADVFYLTVEELTGPDRNLRPLVAHRRAQTESYERMELPASWYGQPDPGERQLGAAWVDRLDGIGVYAGIVEGPARVATTVAEATALEPGEVLVCHTTDPSWASVFPLAGALVIDIGSSASHGAIVARELGIPCVINTGIGTQAVATGDTVRVDGAAGTVEVVGRAT